ncbi:MAG: hypothetical protein ACUVV5_08645 [Candidatus Aminicenantales bacterium]
MTVCFRNRLFLFFAWMAVWSSLAAAAPGEIRLSSERTRIIASEPHQMSAQFLQRELATVAGGEIPIIDDEHLTDEQMSRFDLILLGDLNTNRLTARLYFNNYAFVDAVFPGPGGHFIKTVVDPFGTGRSMILAAGSDAEGTRRAAERLAEIARRLGAQLPLLHDVAAESLRTIIPPARQDVPRLNEENRRLFIESAGESALARAYTYAQNYYFTNDPVWIDLYKGVLFYYANEARARKNWRFAPRLEFYFVLGPLIETWKLIEYDPVFSDGDREEIRWLFSGLAQYLSQITYLTPRGNPSGEPRQNHTTFASLSLDAAYRYFSREGDPRAPAWKAIADRMLAGQLRTHRADDDAGHYGWYAPVHAWVYFRRHEPDRLADNRMIRNLGDLALMLTDNRLDELTHGDVPVYIPERQISDLPAEIVKVSGRNSPGAPAIRPRYLGPVLSIAYYATGDPAYTWGYRWVTHGAPAAPGIQLGIAVPLYAAPLPENTPAPERFFGVKAMMLDDATLEQVASRVLDQHWVPRRGEPYFDKLSIRPSFNEQDEYLAMDGVSALAHGHEDANAVLRLTWKDRIWLADLDYNRALPRYHNTVEIIRDGRTGVCPPLAILRGRVDFGTSGLVSSRLEHYTGLHWTRNIIWLKGKCFVFIDHLEATEEGDYDLRCRWRTLGDAKLAENGRRMDVRQPGASFHVISADPSILTISRDAPAQNDWRAYTYAEGGEKVLVERRREKLAAGASVSFANLLFARADSEPQRVLDLLALDEGIYILDEGGLRSIVGVAPRRRPIGPLEIQADVFRLAPGSLEACNLTFLKRGEQRLIADAPVNLIMNNGRSGIMINEHPVAIRSTGLVFTGEQERPGVHEERQLEPGEHQFIFAGALFNEELVHTLARDGHVPVRRAPPSEVDFGMEKAWELPVGAEATAITNDPAVAGAYYVGLADGRIGRLQPPGDFTEIARMKGDIRALLMLGDQVGPLLVAGDGAAVVSAFRPTGELVWSETFGLNRSRLEKIKCLARLDKADGTRLIVATEGSRIHSFTIDGRREWMSAFNYHSATQLVVTDLDADGDSEIVIGNEYHTPVNVFDDAGNVIWEAWEQVGSESRSTTEYIGTFAHSLLVERLDEGQSPAIVLGTETDEVFSLRPDGRGVYWSANVGGEVHCLAPADLDGDGRKELIAGTGSGYLTALEARGARRWFRPVEGGVTGLRFDRFEDLDLPVIVFSTTGGRIGLLDQEGRLVGLGDAGAPVRLLTLHDRQGKEYLSATADGRISIWRWRPPRSVFGPQFRTGRHRY